MEKFQYLIIGMGIALTLIGLLAGGVVGMNNNSTIEEPVIAQNGTIEENVSEDPQEEVLEETTDLEAWEEIEIREREKLEEEVLSGENEEEIDDGLQEIIEEPVIEPTPDTLPPEQAEPETKAPEVAQPPAKVKPTNGAVKTVAPGAIKNIHLVKKVNKDGYVFVGKDHAGKIVEITINGQF